MHLLPNFIESYEKKNRKIETSFSPARLHNKTRAVQRVTQFLKLLLKEDMQDEFGFTEYVAHGPYCTK